MKEKTIYLNTAYLAPIEYYAKLYSYQNVFIEQYDNYVKQTYRNRCVIASANGPLTLSVPVEKSFTPKCLMKDLRISDHGNWRHLHWNAIESAYGSTPFFEYYQDDFRPFYEKRYVYLFDFNQQLCELVCSLIDLNTTMLPTIEYKNFFADAELDLRDVIHPKRNNYSIACFYPQPYYQVFENLYGFLPNLSIIDLLFNMGPESLLVLKYSSKDV